MGLPSLEGVDVLIERKGEEPMSHVHQLVRGEARGGFVAVVDGSHVSVMSGFGLRFDNHDHPVAWLAAGAVTYGSGGFDPDSILLAISDLDSDDPLGRGDPCTVWGKMVSIASDPVRVARGESGSSGVGTAPVSIRDDQHFVLRGFEFRSTSGRNHNLRRLGVRFDRRRGIVDAVMRDNSPDDDEFHFEVAYTTLDVHTRLLPNPENRFLAGPFRGRFEFTHETSLPLRRSGTPLLTGFDFEFVDDDHHLREVSIDPVSHESYLVRFTDDEADHAVRAMVEYLIWDPHVL